MSTNFISLRSTVTYDSSGVQPSTGTVYTVGNGGNPTWTSTLSGHIHISSLIGSTMTGHSTTLNLLTINSTVTASTLTTGLLGVSTLLGSTVTASGVTTTNMTNNFLIVHSTITTSTLYVSNLDVAFLRGSGIYLAQNGNKFIELGTDPVNTTYIDFHSQDSVAVDYDTRITSYGGNTSTIQQGRMEFLGGKFGFTGGSVGIGTTDPITTLDVNGTATIGTRLQGTVDGSDMFWTSLKGTGTEVDRVAIGIKGNATTGLVDSVSFNTNSANRMIIDSSGNVGIGSATPASKLDIAGNLLLSGTTSDRVLYFLNYSPNIDGSGQGSGYTYQGATAYINIAGAISVTGRNGSVAQSYLGSNVAIQAGSIYSNDYNATINPLVKGGNLYLYGGNGPIGGSTNNGAGSCSHRGGDVILRAGLTNLGGIPGGGAAWVASGDIRMNWVPSHTWVQGNPQPADQTALCVSGSTGYIGIGVTNPQNTLHIRNTIANSTQAPDGAPSSGHILLTNSKSGISAYSMAIGIDQAYGIGYLNVAGNGSVQPLCLNTRGGNVGIGTTNPQTTLDIIGGTIRSEVIRVYRSAGGMSNTNLLGTIGFGDGDGNVTHAATIEAYGAYGGPGDQYGANLRFSTYSWSYTPTGLVERMRITDQGLVGIGITNPSYKLHVVGDIYATANVIAMSDQRVKRDVQPVVGALDRVSALHGYTYLREERETREMGLIAQEVEAVFPEAVHYDKEHDRYGVNYNAMIAPLLEAIKELKAKVEELSQKVMM